MPEDLAGDPMEQSGIALDATAARGGEDLAADSTIGAASLDPVVPDVGNLDWELVLDDDFDGPTLNENVWQVHQGPYAGELYSRDAVRIEEHPDEPGNNMLTLTTYTENGEHRSGQVRTGTVLAGNRPIWSGFLGAYGYAEARIQLNDSQGNKGTFWTMPATGHTRPYGDPAEGGAEIDILETFCDSSASEEHRANLHWGGFEEGRGNDGIRYTNPTGTPLQGNFHTFSLLWTPEGYRFYLDGMEVYRSEHAISYALENFILGQIICQGAQKPASYGSLEDSTTKLMVDYVKVWQRPVSDVPDQSVGQGESLSVPFAVTDHVYADAGHDDPGSVRVSATSDDQGLIDDDKIVVTGNGSANPQGSFANGSFDDGTTGWNLTGPDASLWTGRARTGTHSLRLEKGGGRAEQTITGLQPNTRYMVGGWYNLELQWNDTNSNGQVDAGETFIPPGGEHARLKWGIEDEGLQTSLTDYEPEYVTRARNGLAERNQWWSTHEDDWHHDTILFSTGPDTTEVTLFIDNTEFASGNFSSNLSFDDLYIQPIVPANRTVTMRPEPGASGEATITLTAIDADAQVIGTDDFTVTVASSSFTNGRFESHPAGRGWDWGSGGGAQVVVEEPFTLNRALELGRDGQEHLEQEITGLEPDMEYVLEASGRLDDDHGDAGVVVANHGGPQASVLFTTAGWDTKTTTFQTGPSSTSATVLVLDWDLEPNPNEWSLIDDIRIYPSETAGSGGGPSIPLLADIDELHLPSTSPAAISFDAPGAVISGVESDNPHVLPDVNLGVTGDSGEYVLGVTPVPERAGKATVRVFTNAAQTQWQDIDVVVSEHNLRNPGFESTWDDGWSLSNGAGIVEGTSQRSGERALELPDGGSAGQALVHTTVGQNARLGLPCNTPFAIGGWASGDVKLTVGGPSGTSGTVEWSGGGWSEEQTTFVSPGCYGTGQSFQLTLENTSSTGQTAYVDDLRLFYAPKMSPIRDVSLHQDQTSFGWPNQRDFHVGHISTHALWDPNLVTFTSSDETVVPVSNLKLIKPGDETDAVAAMYTWRLQAIAGTKTGRSDITIAVTDPATNVTTEQTFTVTVNAGTSLDNGDFQRNLTGWEPAWWPFHDLRVRRRTTLPNPPDTDYDQVLRISHGVVRYKVAGLTPETTYVVQASAHGEGSRLLVRNSDSWLFSSIMGEETIDSPSDWSPLDLTFTTEENQTDVWIYLADDDDDIVEDPPGSGIFKFVHNPPGYQPGWPNNEPCVEYDFSVSGTETCFDDIGVFEATDLN